VAIVAVSIFLQIGLIKRSKLSELIEVGYNDKYYYKTYEGEGY
jgi:hypothetical protein